MFYQIHSTRFPASASGWHSRRIRQVLHSIPHYIEEFRDIDSWQEAVDWPYFKTPYLFKLRDFPPESTIRSTTGSSWSPAAAASVWAREKINFSTVGQAASRKSATTSGW
jgi:hypothetical protein